MSFRNFPQRHLPASRQGMEEKMSGIQSQIIRAFESANHFITPTLSHPRFPPARE